MERTISTKFTNWWTGANLEELVEAEADVWRQSGIDLNDLVIEDIPIDLGPQNFVGTNDPSQMYIHTVKIA